MKRENDKGAPVKSKNTLLITVLGIAAFLIVALFVAMNVNLGADTIPDNLGSSDNPDTLVTGDDVTPSPNELCETTSLIDSLFGIQSAQAQETDGAPCPDDSGIPTSNDESTNGGEDESDFDRTEETLSAEDLDNLYGDTREGYNECRQDGFTHEECNKAAGGYRNEDGSFNFKEYAAANEFAKIDDKDGDKTPDNQDPAPYDPNVKSDSDTQTIGLDLTDKTTDQDFDNDGIQDSLDPQPTISNDESPFSPDDEKYVSGTDERWTPKSQNPPSFRNPKFKDENGIIDSKKYMQALDEWTKAQNGSIGKVGTVVPDASVGTGPVSGSGTSESEKSLAKSLLDKLSNPVQSLKDLFGLNSTLKDGASDTPAKSTTSESGGSKPPVESGTGIFDD